MNELLKLKRITSYRDVEVILLLYGDIGIHVRSLDGLRISSQEYEALLAPVIIERLLT